MIQAAHQHRPDIRSHHLQRFFRGEAHPPVGIAEQWRDVVRPDRSVQFAERPRGMRAHVRERIVSSILRSRSAASSSPTFPSDWIAALRTRGSESSVSAARSRFDRFLRIAREQRRAPKPDDRIGVEQDVLEAIGESAEAIARCESPRATPDAAAPASASKRMSIARGSCEAPRSDKATSATSRIRIVDRSRQQIEDRRVIRRETGCAAR